MIKKLNILSALYEYKPRKSLNVYKNVSDIKLKEDLLGLEPSRELRM